MKTFTGLFTALTLAALALTGCVNEEPPYKSDGSDSGSDSSTTGYLSGGEMSLRVIYDSQTDSQSDDTEDATQTPPSSRSVTRATPETDDFRVRIVSADGLTTRFEGSYTELLEDLEAGPMELPVGSYDLTVCSHADTEIQAAAWNTPVYGASRSFSITKGETTSIGEIVCTLQNIKVTLLCSADLADQLADDTSVTISLGDNTLEFTKELWDGKQAAFFMPEAEENDLAFKLSGTFVEGGDVSFSRTISGVKAGQWRKIELVIAYADQGEIKFDISVDNFVLDDTITINGTEGLWEQVLDEEDGGDEGGDGGGESDAPTIVMITDDHDLAEPYVMNEIKDIEIAITAPNGGIKELLVTVEAPALEPLLEEIGLGSLITPGVDLCEPDETAAEVLGSVVGFPVGDEVRNQTAIPFKVGAMFVEILANLDPQTEGVPNTYKFNLKVTDNAGSATSATLTLVQADK